MRDGEREAVRRDKERLRVVDRDRLVAALVTMNPALTAERFADCSPESLRHRVAHSMRINRPEWFRLLGLGD